MAAVWLACAAELEAGTYQGKAEEKKSQDKVASQQCQDARASIVPEHLCK